MLDKSLYAIPKVPMGGGWADIHTGGNSASRRRGNGCGLKAQPVAQLGATPWVSCAPAALRPERAAETFYPSQFVYRSGDFLKKYP